jgi:hypothetical protein
MIESDYNAINVTYIGLHKWSCAMFEKFGWMLLAKDRKHDTRIAAYVQSIDHLILAAKKKHAEVSDSDHKKDIIILLRNMEILRSHVNKTFGTPARRVQTLRGRNATASATRQRK